MILQVFFYSIIDHLQTSPIEFISKLIAVTSLLDAMVAYTNVLHPSNTLHSVVEIYRIR